MSRILACESAFKISWPIGSGQNFGVSPPPLEKNRVDPDECVIGAISRGPSIFAPPPLFFDMCVSPVHSLSSGTGRADKKQRLRRVPTRPSVSVSADMSVAGLQDDGGMDVPGTDGRAGSGDAALIAENRALRQALAERDARLAALAARLDEGDNRLADLTDPGRELQAGIRLPGNCRDVRTRSRPGWRNRCAGTGKRRRPAPTGRGKTAGRPRPAAPEPGPAPP